MPLVSKERYGSQVPFIQWKQRLSEEFLQACEETEVIVVSRFANEEFANYPQLETFARKLIEEQIILTETISRDFNRIKAQEKYNRLEELYPKLFKRAKLGDIASIIGVTSETLSRIRRKK